MVEAAQVTVPAVSLVGRTLSGNQLLLPERFKRIILLLDGDEPGKEAAGQIAPVLGKGRWLYTADLAGGIQPDELSPEEN